jgi:hypothetical protein
MKRLVTLLFTQVTNKKEPITGHAKQFHTHQGNTVRRDDTRLAKRGKGVYQLTFRMPGE